MKKICFLYIQTSSIQSNYDIPYTDFNNWTRIVSISYSVTNEFMDKFYFEKYCLIRPQGFFIDTETEKYNKISNDFAINNGENLIDVLKNFIEKTKNVDFFVGHNIEFHLKVLKSELLRNGFEDLIVEKTICLMKYGASECKIPHNNGYKYPTLEELNYSLTKSKISTSNYNNQYIYLFGAVKSCFKILFNNNKFFNLNLVPDRKFELINVPFKKDKFPDCKILTIEELNINKYNIHLNKNILFENIEDLIISDDWGFYLFKKIKNNSSEKIIDYFLIDYRGVIILHTSNRPINFGFDYFGDANITVNNYQYAEVAFYINGLFIIKTGQSKYINSRDNTKKIIEIKHSDDEFTIVDNVNGNILFQKENVIYDSNLKYFIKINNINANVFDSKSMQSVNRFELNGKINLHFLNNNDLLFFEYKNKWGIIKIDGKVLLNSEYDFLIENEDDTNLFEYTKNKKNGLIRLDGKIIFEDIFKFECKIFNDYILIENIESNLLGLINKNGEIILPVEYDEINYEEEYFEIKKNNKIGLFLISNNTLIPAFFDFIEYKNAFIFVEIDKMEGVFDLNGKIVLECKYIFGKHYNFINNEYLEIKNNDNYDLINLHNLKYIFKNFTSSKKIGKTNDFIICIQKDELVKFINVDNHLETDFIFNDISEKASSKDDRQHYLDHFRFNDNRLIVIKNGLYGFIDKKFIEIIKCQFDDALPFKDGKAKVSNKNENYYIDVNGLKI